MSARDLWRWVSFSLTGRVPGRGGTMPAYAPTGDDQPVMLSEGKRVADQDEAEALGLTAEPPATTDEFEALTGPLAALLGGDRGARVIAYTLGSHGYSTAAVQGMSDAQLLAIPGIGETSLARIRRHVPGGETVHASPPLGSGVTPCCGVTPFELPRTDRMTPDSEAVTCGQGDTADPFDIAHDSEAKRIVRVLMMSGLNEFGATAIRDAYLAEATRGTVPVPRGALRGLVEVARVVVAERVRLGPEAALPDFHARRALAALDDAGLLDQFSAD